MPPDFASTSTTTGFIQIPSSSCGRVAAPSVRRPMSASTASHCSAAAEGGSTEAATQMGPVGEPIGYFHSWWRGDGLQTLPTLPGLAISAIFGAEDAAAAIGMEVAEVRSRLERGHRLWMARLNGDPVGWGWCATRELGIGELDIARVLPPGDRYLWDFCTVPPRRGIGIYPRLLQAIVASEPQAERFWVGHDLGNLASARGIIKAGFREVGVVYRRGDGAYWMAPSPPLDRAVAAATIFGVPVAGHPSARIA